MVDKYGGGWWGGTGIDLGAGSGVSVGGHKLNENLPKIFWAYERLHVAMTKVKKCCESQAT